MIGHNMQCPFEHFMPDSTVKRPHFFSGKLLTADDLAQEQQYTIEKFKRHNRTLHGFGIVSGLKVTAKAGQIVVQPGLALDCEGNELSIETVQVVDPPKNCEGHTVYLNVRFVELESDPVRIADGEKFASITESFEFVFTQENANRGHRHLRARWLTCAQPHALTIAKLRSSSQGWRVDRGYRPPIIK